MNYRHAFHAGNFADVHKHVVLLALLDRLKQKAAPFFALDTHAGRGLYDLRSAEAQRGAEWRSGVNQVLDAKHAPPEIEHYAQCVRQLQKDAALSLYPGSPLLIASQLRRQDRGAFIEQHPEEAGALSANLRGRARIATLEQDGYAALKSLLPPKENRGLVLIDPPFEAADEWARLADALQLGLQRWPNGIFCAWYPIKSGSARARFLDRMQKSGFKKLLTLELCVQPPDSPLGLNGSGLLLANPPYQLDERMRVVLPALHTLLASEGGVRVEWLAGE